MGQASAAYLRTLHRQHKTTIRKLDRIQKELDAIIFDEQHEEPKERSSLVEWFYRLMGH